MIKSTTFFAALITSLCIVLGCSKIRDLITFNIHNETTFRIPSAIGINTPFNLPASNVKTSSNQAFQNNNTRKELVKDVILTKLDLTIEAPEQANFSNLKSIEIFIQADGIDEKLIAFKHDISSSQGKTLVLETANDKLDEYIKKDSYNLRTNLVLREAYLYNVDIKANMTFKVTANVVK
jgi:hypothetical protein